jgi:hypothetical protein
MCAVFANTEHHITYKSFSVSLHSLGEFTSESMGAVFNNIEDHGIYGNFSLPFHPPVEFTP